MGYQYQRWLADEFRAAGLEVREVAGWKSRGRPASTGHFDPNGANTVHHNGVTSSSRNPAPGLSVLIQGRAGLPGPLCHYAVDYNGVVWVIAAGRANHAGRIGKSGVLGMPYLGDGNRYALGNEVITNGTQTLSAKQKLSIAVTSAVVVKHFKRTHQWVHRHQDISSTGKWDIGQLTTSAVRSLVKDQMKTGDWFDMATKKELKEAVREELAPVLEQFAKERKRDKNERQRDKRRFQRLRDLAKAERVDSKALLAAIEEMEGDGDDAA